MVSTQAKNEEYFEEKVLEVTTMYQAAKYDETRRKCQEFLSQLDEDDKKHRRFYFKYLSFCDFREDKFDKALEYADEALELAETKSDYYSDLWNKARIFMYLGKTKLALRLFDDCIKFYLELNMYKQVGELLVTKGRAAQNYEDVLEGIEYYNKVPNLNSDTYDHAYKVLSEIYLSDIHTYGLKAECSINKIKNSDIKEQYKLKLQEARENAF